MLHHSANCDGGSLGGCSKRQARAVSVRATIEGAGSIDGVETIVTVEIGTGVQQEGMIVVTGGLEV